jgi:hypothetical protein
MALPFESNVPRRFRVGLENNVGLGNNYALAQQIIRPPGNLSGG